MALNFDSLPTSKPSQNSIADGTYTATVFKAEMRTSQAGNEYLNVSFKTDAGFVNENYFESDKPFIQWKLGQLLKACKVTLSGEGSLKDVAKVIAGKKVVIDVVVNDRGYGALDYTGSKDGIRAAEETVSTSAELDPELEAAIETNFDDEF